ncbi:hypothetical protein [Vibrio harveyi]|uniref:hypothetical protein n=1 Tax=Vibrio harveyi TaxID=669 RepID=UPI0028910FA1|nr:hypothetical protein [Vibrio harveyi]
MTSFLVLLQEQGLLTPISTMTTGALAFLAVFINNVFLRTNLNKQLKAQAIENQKQRAEKAHLLGIKEKKDKLEEVSEHLHQYLIEFEECNSISNNLSSNWETPSKVLLQNLKDLREKFTVSQLHLSKAELIALAYSDSINDTFERIRSQEAAINEHIELLINYELIMGDRKPNEDTEIENIEKHLWVEKLLSSHTSNSKAYREIRSMTRDINRAIVEEIKATK